VTLRLRLILSFTALLLVVTAALGTAAIRSVRSVLTEQIDQRLVMLAGRLGRRVPGLGANMGPGGSSIAVIILTADGELVRWAPSGLPGDPDSVPDLAGVLALLTDGSAVLVTVPSADGSFDYRALMVRLERFVVVLASPLREVVAAERELIRKLILRGAGVLVLGGVATWWTVRRGLRPVNRMIDTAAAIAEGDLSKRVTDDDPSTELGKLGGALNEMLSHVEQSFAAEQEAQRRLRQFVADASHELRTPIAAIAGYAELYRKGGLPLHEDVDRALQRIESEGGRMKRLVEDLLLLARMDEARPLTRRKVDLASVVGDAAADHRAIDPERPITVDSPDSLWIEGDGLRLSQVIGNLLANTRAHTPAGTPVEVSVRRAGGTVVLGVTDDGPGIPEEALGRVFDRFYRADVSRTRKSGGSGLGLAIVAAIVAAHGGTVEATNPTGRGAKITVTLPD
jgi:two-component system OmpR family sensor kinase